MKLSVLLLLLHPLKKVMCFCTEQSQWHCYPVLAGKFTILSAGQKAYAAN